MKIAIASDLHLEFGDVNLVNTENADVLVLAGDILIAEDLARHDTVTNPYNTNRSHRWEKAVRYREFLSRVSGEFPQTVMIAGNHEFYHGDWPGHINVLIDECNRYGNIKFLEQRTHTIDDVVFVGSTLWTDMNKGNPLSLQIIQEGMQDFNVIRNDMKGYTKFRPAQAAEYHRNVLDYFRVVMEGHWDRKYVVVSHHAPTSGSVHPQYLTGPYSELNGAYYSDLSEWILDRPQIKLWIHGHTHHRWDYMVGTTRVVCNPRGYHGYEDRADNFKLEYVDV